MFAHESQLQNTWHVCFATGPTTHDIDQDVHDALAVPTTNLSESNINGCVGEDVTKQQCQVPHETFKELYQQGELFKDILQRIILPA